MRKLLWVSVLLLLVGCAGMKVPFSDSEERHLRKMIKTSDHETNTDCIGFQAFQAVARRLESQHVHFLGSKNVSDSLTRGWVVSSLGDTCTDRIKGLTTDEVRFQLFGGLQTIPNPERLQYLGGILFEYEQTLVFSGLRPTFHLEQNSSGPLRGLVAIYNLETGQVLHFVYSGTDNVDKRELTWPLLEFLGLVAKAGSDAIVP